ncbi:unnamed protein product [Phytophthora fragariaefolia]|uniref:Unnamed protein product n=1 Tax=Phytophthora fragariaefolia TaxID=1490495 RepID=A0A9W7CFE1_9STRA|nr:unnamed protein product [Phytophthora fragariaefolia]
MPAAFTTFLEELGALQLVIPAPPAASGSSEASAPATPASSETPGGAATTSGSSTALTVASNSSDESGPIAPSELHKGKGKRPAKPSAKPRSSPPPPKKMQRLGRPSVDLKARKAAQQAISAAANRIGLPQSSPPPLPVTSAPASSAPVSGIAVSADSSVLSFASASVPVEVDEDGGAGDGEAVSESSGPLGEVFSTPVVTQPRRDGRPTRATSTTAALRSMTAIEVGNAPDALVLGLTTPPAHQRPPKLRPSPGLRVLQLGLSSAALAESLGECAYREHPFNATFAPFNPSVLLFVPEGKTQEEVGEAIVVNPALRQSHLTAPWVHEFADARAQAVADDESAAADSPSDTASDRTPIPAADQADVQAELGANAPAQDGPNVLADLASTAEISVSVHHFTFSRLI